MKVLIDQLFVDWDELETPEEYEIMKRYAKNGRRYSLGYSCKNKSSISLFILFYLQNYNLATVKRTFHLCCSVLLFWFICVYIYVPCTTSVGCCFASQWVPSYTADISRILFRWRKKIFLLYFLTFYNGLGNCCDCDSLPRLYASNLHRTCLQHFRISRVKTI